MTSTDRQPTLFIPHGGGPCFFMEPGPGMPRDLWDRLAAYLKGIDKSLGRRPKAVLVISGHWEMPRPTVNTAQNHTLLFDYYGFPQIPIASPTPRIIRPKRWRGSRNCCRAPAIAPAKTRSAASITACSCRSS